MRRAAWRTPVVAMVLSVAARAHAESAQVDLVSDPDACPNGKLVESQLDPLLGVDATTRSGRTPAVVRDEGARYTIEVGDAHRTVDDPERRCLDRARVAAVFIALNLSRLPEPAKAEVSRDVRQPLAAPEHAWLALDAFARVVMAPGRGLAAPGGGMDIAVRRANLRLALELGILGPVTIKAERAQTGSVELVRAPTRLSLGYIFGGADIALGPYAGLALDLMYVRGRDVPDPQSALRPNLGVDFGLRAEYRMSSTTQIWFELDSALFPISYELLVESSGAIGHTPRSWLGASLGVGFGAAPASFSARAVKDGLPSAHR